MIFFLFCFACHKPKAFAAAVDVLKTIYGVRCSICYSLSYVRCDSFYTQTLL